MDPPPVDVGKPTSDKEDDEVTTIDGCCDLSCDSSKVSTQPSKPTQPTKAKRKTTQAVGSVTTRSQAAEDKRQKTANTKPSEKTSNNMSNSMSEKVRRGDPLTLWEKIDLFHYELYCNSDEDETYEEFKERKAKERNEAKAKKTVDFSNLSLTGSSEDER
jgi:hypothetical protein